MTATWCCGIVGTSREVDEGQREGSKDVKAQMSRLKLYLIAALVAIETIVLAAPAHASFGAAQAPSTPSSSAGSAFPPLLGYTDSSGNFFVKQGLFGSWIREASNVKDSRGAVLTYTPGGSLRIGFLDTSGNFFVKEGALNAGWTLETSSAQGIALSADLIGFSDSAGRAFVKRGSVNAGWVLEATLSSPIFMALTYTRAGLLRIGLLVGGLSTGDDFLVKEGSLTAGWTLEAHSAIDIALSGDLIAQQTHPLSQLRNLYVKQGPLAAPWAFEQTGNLSMALTYTQPGSLRIGALDANHGFQIKDGSLTADWSPAGYGDSSFVDGIGLSGDLIAWVDESLRFMVATSPQSAPILEANPVSSFALAGG